MWPAVLVRAASLVALVLVGWSVNLRWGAGDTVRAGPPGAWERAVIGAALLAAIAAILSWLASRAGPSRRRFSVAATLAAAAVAAIPLYLRADATDRGLPNLLAGPGWPWLSAGAAVALAAALASFAIRPRPVSRRSAARRGAAAR